MTAPEPSVGDDVWIEHAGLVASRLTETALLLPEVAVRIIANEISPAELLTLANRLHDIAGHIGLVADHRERHPDKNHRASGRTPGS